MNSADRIKTLLLDDIHEFASNPILFAKHPDTDFSRNRKLSAEDTLRFTLFMERDSTSRELLKYFDYSLTTPSTSAYYQQRRKIFPDSFHTLLTSFNSHFSPTFYKHNYILTAVDGSGVNIPRNPSDLDSYHPPTGKSPLGYNEIHVVAAYCLPDRVYTDAIIQPDRKKNEYSAICDLVDRCQTDQGIPLFLADRGFPSLNLFAHVKEKGVRFLVRAKDLYVQRLLDCDMPAESGEFDITIHRIVTRSHIKKYRSQPDKPELYRYVDKNTTFDYIEPGSSAEYPLQLRVVRVKLSDNAYENLITNLSPDEFTMEELRILYYIRWGIETSFRELKYAVGAVDFHCKSVEYIEHEVWARLLLYNFCSRITSLAVVKQKDTKYLYQVNYTMAIKNCHDFLRQSQANPPMSIVGLIEKYILPVRPDRIFARQHRFQTPMKFIYRH